MGGTSFNYESNSSAIKATISNGIFVDTELRAVELNDTVPTADFVDAENIVPMLWGCLQTIEASDSGYGWTKIANNEQTSFNFQRQIQTVPDCGERIDTAFWESGVSAIKIGAKVYSRNGNQWQTRMHSGGIRNDIAIGQVSKPRRKGLQTIPNIRIATATSDLDYTCYAQFEDISVDSWGNTYNMNGEIVENPSLTALRGFIAIKTPDMTSPLLASEYKNARKVTLDYGNNNTIEMYYPDGFKLMLPDCDVSGFDGWKVGNVTYSARQSVRITADTVFTAQIPVAQVNH